MLIPLAPFNVRCTSSAGPWNVFLRGRYEVLRTGIRNECVSVLHFFLTGLRPLRGGVHLFMLTDLPPPLPNYARFVRVYCGSGIPVHLTGVTQLNSSLLTISVIAVLLPAAFHTAAGAQIPDDLESKEILAVSHGVSPICLPAQRYLAVSGTDH